jgi:hypothetical protein
MKHDSYFESPMLGRIRLPLFLYCSAVPVKDGCHGLGASMNI